MNEREIVLADFEAVTLARPMRQEHLLSYLAWLLASARCANEAVTDAEAAADALAEVQRRLQRYAVGPNSIARRQCNFFPDSEEALGQRGGAPALPADFEKLTHEPAGPTLDRRMRRFEALAFEVFARWYERRSHAPNDLIHVTCSGYASPSPAQRWIGRRGWYSTAVTHSYHMDGYGAFPAIRTAVGLLTSPLLARPAPKTRVDIVHTEYLSAHVPTLEDPPGDLVDMTLFGDGFIGYSAYPADVFQSRPELGPGLRVLALDEELIPDSTDEMTCRLGPRQFQIHLSKGVPLLIRECVVAFTRRLCAAAGLALDAEKDRMLFAIHPGGPKVLDHCRDALGVREDQVAHARHVFREHGNMSSATVPHVLMAMNRSKEVYEGRKIVALGFGPGLTATGALLEKTRT